MTSVKKQNKFFFYIKGYSQRLWPHAPLEKEIGQLMKQLSREEKDRVEYRLNYYNKLSSAKFKPQNGTVVKDLLHPKTPKAYYFDTYEYARYFDKNLPIDYAFGDVNTILPHPMVCKSRPIHGGNENNVLLNLDKARHFVSVDDKKEFGVKKDILLGRGALYQGHRIDFYKKYFDHPLCDLGQVNKVGGDARWIKKPMSIPEHLDYKFILSLEGNDVATNLKWIMSSKSIAVCPPLKMETWYMEGELLPDVHFIGIKSDYSNLEEKLEYYINHQKEAQDIIKNANLHRNLFCNPIIEDLVSLLVLKKYFELISK